MTDIAFVMVVVVVVVVVVIDYIEWSNTLRLEDIPALTR